MSLDVLECGRCLKIIRNGYSGQHLCEGCAKELGRDQHDPWWGTFWGSLEPKELPNGRFQVAA